MSKIVIHNRTSISDKDALQHVRVLMSMINELDLPKDVRRNVDIYACIKDKSGKEICYVRPCKRWWWQRHETYMVELPGEDDE